MNSEDFRKMLVEMVKASGQEVIDIAEDLVGNGDLITDFNIWISFPTDGRMLIGYPEIEVTRSHIEKHAYEVLIGRN